MVNRGINAPIHYTDYGLKPLNNLSIYKCFKPSTNDGIPHECYKLTDYNGNAVYISAGLKPVVVNDLFLYNGFKPLRSTGID